MRGASHLMSDEIRTAVIAILADRALCDPSDVRMDQSPAELGLDSLGVVETIFAIEERFDISVPFNANAPAATDFDISSTAAIVAAVERLVADQRG